MKNICYCLISLFLLSGYGLRAQTITQLGLPNVQDDPRDLLFATDGGFITTGTKGTNGILYKTDCTGNVVAQIEKSTAPSVLAFFDAVQLPDNSIVAVGYVSLAQTPTDTLDHLVILKTDAELNEIAFADYPIPGKHTRGKSVAVGQDGALLVFGDVSGPGVDFWDLYFLRVHPVTLQPVAPPVIYNFGVDNAQEIVPAGNNAFLLTGSGLIGNIFDPEALISNRLTTLKVNDQGTVIWQYYYQNIYKGKYGFCRSGGVAKHPATGNIMRAGTLYTAAPDSLPDPVFILLNDQGTALDTFTEVIPGRQNLFSTIADPTNAGLSLSLGETAPPAGPPTLLLLTPVEFNNQILFANAVNDTLTPVSLRDIVEVPVNRFAFTGTIPDNPANSAVRNIIVATPEIDDIEILYQNCALTASFNAPGPSYQWFRNGIPVPGANSGFYFPKQTGVYQVVITDAIGCVGVSDTLTVTLPAAGFYTNPSNGAYTFTNTSVGGSSYKWLFGDGATSTEANPTHTYATSTSYPVTLIVYGPCGNDTLTNTLVETGEPAVISDYRLFPNPNDGHFTLEVSGDGPEVVALSLCNTIGQVIERREGRFFSGKMVQTFGYDDLPPGVYTLFMHTGGAGRHIKVVIR